MRGRRPGAGPGKTLRYILPAAETSFDPAVARDLYTGHVLQAIFDTLYSYAYLARPVQLLPAAAAAPTIRRPPWRAKWWAIGRAAAASCWRRTRTICPKPGT